MTLPGTSMPPPTPSVMRTPLADDAAPLVPARWSRRVLGALLDHGLLAGVTWLALGDLGAVPEFSFPFAPYQAGQVPWTASWWVVGALAAVIALQAWTGWSPGKLVVGIAVVRDRDGRPAGLWRTLLRWLAHLLDAILLIGYLRPLWHPQRRTFADSLCSTLVVRSRPVALGPQREYVATAAAFVLCVGGMALTFTWASWGGAAAHGSATCDPRPVAGVADDVARQAGVELTGTEIRHVERRLWMARVTDVARTYNATWLWNTTTTPTGDLALELTAVGPSGERVTSRWGIEGRSSETTTVMTEQAGIGTDLLRAQVSLDDGVATSLGTVTDLTTSFLVDGQVVATCTVEGFTLTESDG